MNIAELKKERENLDNLISTLIRQFEEKTDLRILSIGLTRTEVATGYGGTFTMGIKTTIEI